MNPQKWITNGMFCDYFVTGCKTDKGFSVILIPRDDTVETKLIKTAYSTTAGTAFVEFNNTKVPVQGLLGKEHQGFTVISKALGIVTWTHSNIHNSVEFQPRALYDGLRRDPTIPYHRRGVP